MEDNKDNQVRAGLLFLGCNMAGLGLGFIYDQIPGGLFLGVGSGFIATALAWKK